MTYFNINYNKLKDYIFNQKELYDSVDILCLLDMGLINQQQYEDLMAVIARPMYNYKDFYHDNVGYYRMQGPLTNQQSYKGYTA